MELKSQENSKKVSIKLYFQILDKILKLLKNVKEYVKPIEKVNYIEILKEKSLSNLDSKPSKSRIFISITIDGVRLIDNIAVREKLVHQRGLIKTVK